MVENEHLEKEVEDAIKSLEDLENEDSEEKLPEKLPEPSILDINIPDTEKAQESLEFEGVESISDIPKGKEKDYGI